MGLEVDVWGLGFRVWGLGFRLLGLGSGFIGCRVDSFCFVFICKLCFCKELRRVLPECSDLFLGLFECGESALDFIGF